MPTTCEQSAEPLSRRLKLDEQIGHFVDHRKCVLVGVELSAPVVDAHPSSRKRPDGPRTATSRAHSRRCSQLEEMLSTLLMLRRAYRW